LELGTLGILVGTRGFFLKGSEQLIATCSRRDPKSLGFLARYWRFNDRIASDSKCDLEPFFASRR
jgi:hypothetical protein